jgi:hypothetical protein
MTSPQALDFRNAVRIFNRSERYFLFRRALGVGEAIYSSRFREDLQAARGILLSSAFLVYA